MAKRERLEAMLVDDPDDVFLNYALAQVLGSEGATDESLARYGRVTELDPEYVPAYFQRGQLLARTGNVPAAREVLLTGIDVARRTGDSHALGEMTEFLATLE